MPARRLAATFYLSTSGFILFPIARKNSAPLSFRIARAWLAFRAQKSFSPEGPFCVCVSLSRPLSLLRSMSRDGGAFSRGQGSVYVVLHSLNLCRLWGVSAVQENTSLLELTRSETRGKETSGFLAADESVGFCGFWSQISPRSEC